MKLSDKQISLISSLINEGLSVQKDSDITKKKYLEKAVSKLISIYDENNEEVSPSIMLMNVPKISIENGDGQIDPSYPDFYVIVMVQKLKDIRTEYYLDQQLCESRKQTCWTRWAFIISLLTLIATIIGSCIGK